MKKSLDLTHTHSYRIEPETLAELGQTSELFEAFLEVGRRMNILTYAIESGIRHVQEAAQSEPQDRMWEVSRVWAAAVGEAADVVIRMRGTFGRKTYFAAFHDFLDPAEAPKEDMDLEIMRIPFRLHSSSPELSEQLDHLDLKGSQVLRATEQRRMDAEDADPPVRPAGEDLRTFYVGTCQRIFRFLCGASEFIEDIALEMGLTPLSPSATQSTDRFASLN